MQSPYAPLIQVYFPPDQWENADCITMHEDGSQDPTRVSPPNSNGTRDHGLFQINDGVWDPDANPRSPFTRQQWAARYDPNTNIWMASVIFQGNGWGDWSTRFLCGVQDITGRHTIPYPNGPIAVAAPGGSQTPGGGMVATPYNPGGGSFVTLLGFVVVIAGGIAVAMHGR